jgi:arsenate reductase (glutaredoxin)
MRRNDDMSTLTFHGIASCDTCRKARRWLDAHGVDYRVHDLREDGLDIQTLERWSDRADWQTLLNTKSLTWRRLPEVDRTNVTRDRALALMLDHPTLVKRPVLEYGKSVTVGFTPEAYEALLRKT